MFILRYCYDEVYDAEKGLFGCIRAYPYHSSIFTDNSEPGGESTDGSYIVEGKVYVNKFSWLKVNGVNCCYFVEICGFSV